MAKKTNTKKRKTARVVESARIYIKSSFNNTMISATSESGETLAWSSTGKAGFKGTKKSTPFAATQATRLLIERLRDFQVKQVKIFVSGVSTGRDAALRAIATAGVKIVSIKDITPVPHNGCRAKKPRRV
ncbi:MAG: 30S ribosomal protein S11 [Candidatus Berkelbacteria bacterium]|nr:30S ribosomal protein S11 [Candidatus Berkelbacteria bacterium]